MLVVGEVDLFYGSGIVLGVGDGSVFWSVVDGDGFEVSEELVV